MAKCGLDRRSYLLFLMQPEFLKDANWSSYKKFCRDLLRKWGYNIILSAGDQWGDLLPLPPYGTNEDKRFHREHIRRLRDDKIYFYSKDGTLNVKVPSE